MKRVGAILLLIMVAAGAGVAGSYLAFGRSETTTAVTTVDQTRTVTRTSKAARPADDEVPAQYRDLGSCYAFDRGSDLAINFIASDAGAACWKLAQANARNGDYWSVSEKAPTSVSPQQQPYCTMQYKGGGQAYVYDTGGAFGGQRVCASLVAHGWTETSGDI